MTEGLNFIYS